MRSSAAWRFLCGALALVVFLSACAVVAVPLHFLLTWVGAADSAFGVVLCLAFGYGVGLRLWGWGES